MLHNEIYMADITMISLRRSRLVGLLRFVTIVTFRNVKYCFVSNIDPVGFIESGFSRAC
jgi:hypothetical protein